MLGDYEKSRWTPRIVDQFNVNGQLFWGGGFNISPKRSYVRGEKLPNHKSVIASGGNATTVLEAVQYSYEDSRPQVSAYDKASNRLYTGSYYTNIVQNPDGLPNLLSDARMKAVEAKCLEYAVSYVRSRQTPFQAQIFLGELPEVLQLLRNPLESSLRLARAFEKSKSKTRRVKELSKLWLEFRFAILPLMSDISDIVALYNKQITEVEKNRFFAEDSASSSTTSRQANLLWYQNNTVTQMDTYQAFLRFGIVFDRLDTHDGLVDYFANAVTDVSQLGLTAWELTPYSFLIDYFANIDTIISASTLAGINMNYTSFSKVRTWKSVGQSVGESWYSSAKDPNYPIPPSARFVSSKRTVNRSKLTSLVPPLTFTLPSSGVKLANLTALIISSLSNQSTRMLDREIRFPRVEHEHTD